MFDSAFNRVCRETCLLFPLWPDRERTPIGGTELPFQGFTPGWLVVMSTDAT